MDARMLASDPARSLAWLAGAPAHEGWVTVDRIHHQLQCMLCGAALKAQTMFNHGMAHLAATAVEFDALASLVSLIASEKHFDEDTIASSRSARRQIFEEAVDQVFGFRPGTPEARKFWQEHGEQI